ncbi:MAG: hypothetical protein LDLANPLL_01364 [Turneriella sp.]|nr:hypothetical protein [Turneriella sp.]
MSKLALSDTQFFIYGESAIVANVLKKYLVARNAKVVPVKFFEEIQLNPENHNVLIAHYSVAKNLAEKLQRLKNSYDSFRILLLHEFIDRGKISQPILSVTDHLLEKPFSRTNLEKALSQFYFRPLLGKNIFSTTWTSDTLASPLITSLGATVFDSLPQLINEKPKIELAIFSPRALDEDFRLTLKTFRKEYADVPIFMIYDPEIPGVLNSAILNEVAYLLQQPIQRKVLRSKLLEYFEQPQRDRRKNPRKKGISQVWVSAYNAELNAPELFESPVLIDISQSGMSFESHTEYRERQKMSVWIVADENPDKILDLHAEVRWKRKDEGGGHFKYGIEFTKENPTVYDNFARMIAMHLG